MLIVKIGGGAAINLEAVATDLANLQGPVVVVLGANAARNRLAQQLGKEVRVITSLSGYDSVLSDREAVELLMMAYAGLRNKSLVELLLQKGVNAIGLSGLDGRLLVGRRNPGIRTRQDGKRIVLRDLSGKPVSLNKPLLSHLLETGYMPVLSVPIVDESGFALNTENDEIVALLQRELNADKVVHLIEAPGLLRDPEDSGSLIPALTPSELEKWEEQAAGRMKRKLRAMGKLFQNSSPGVYVGDGRIEDPIHRVLSGEGTVIR